LNPISSHKADKKVKKNFIGKGRKVDCQKGAATAEVKGC